MSAFRTVLFNRHILKLSIISVLLLVFLGCVSGGNKPIVIQQYTLDYPSPEFSGMSRLNTVIMVDRFSIAQAYNSKMMVYQTAPFKYSNDAYNRWRVNPADMITDCLSRDLRNAGLFKAAFSYRDAGSAGYIVKGRIEELIDSDVQGKSQAILALSVSLMDATQNEIVRRVVFQKTYRVVQPIERSDTESYVQAMSRAMEQLSKQIITDTYQAVRQASQALEPLNP